jgi:hypothetical protein
MHFGAGSRFLQDPAFPLALLTPLVTYLLTSELWSFSGIAWWSVTLGATAFYLGLAWMLYRSGCENMGEIHLLTASVLLAVGWAIRLEGSLLLVALVAEAAVLHVVSRRLQDRLLGGFAHVLTLGVGLWVAVRILALDAQSPPVLNARAMSDLFALALALGTSWLHASPDLRRGYRLAVHILFLGWLYREFAGQPSGQAYVSVAWGVYAVVLLVLGFRLDRHVLRLTALCTIGLVVGKLFLVDLAQVQALWRVLLFMGFGALFLLLSYFLPNLLKPTREVDSG